jgi:hypothetical protein
MGQKSGYMLAELDARLARATHFVDAFARDRCACGPAQFVHASDARLNLAIEVFKARIVELRVGPRHNLRFRPAPLFPHGADLCHEALFALAIQVAERRGGFVKRRRKLFGVAETSLSVRCAKGRKQSRQECQTIQMHGRRLCLSEMLLR